MVTSNSSLIRKNTEWRSGPPLPAQVGERIWLVTFMDYDDARLEPIENPSVRYVSGKDQLKVARPAGLEPAASWFVVTEG